MTDEFRDGIETIKLPEKIDSNNCAATEEEIMSLLDGLDVRSLVMDAEDLAYISSAGLRVMLRLKKKYSDFKIMGVCSDVYDIFEMTGFTEMMTVERAYRSVSVEGCEVIGEGNNGKVYRLDQDKVVKVYKDADALDEIQNEREVAKLALILGVPTAISYEIVRVDDSYGSIFELLDAQSFAKILAREPERMQWCVDEYVNMLKGIHGIMVPEGKLPPKKDKSMAQIGRIKKILPEGIGDKLEKMAEEIPETMQMIHGDYHTNNIVLVGDEVLLIDMDTLCTGHPIYEFAQMYNAYRGFSEYDPNIVFEFQGYDADTAYEFWRRSLKAYLGFEDEAKVTEVENKIRCIAYAYLIDRKYRHGETESEEDKATLALWTGELVELVEQLDSLCFDA